MAHLTCLSCFEVCVRAGLNENKVGLSDCLLRSFRSGKAFSTLGLQ